MRTKPKNFDAFDKLKTCNMKIPAGTTKEQWDAYEIEKAAFEARMESIKPQMPSSLDFPISKRGDEEFHYAMEEYKKAYREWDRAHSMDAPNKPGYYRSNND